MTRFNESFNLDIMDLLKNINQAELAKRINKSKTWLNMVSRGRVKATIPLALKIEEATDGEIKAVDLRPDLIEIVRKVSNL